MGSPQLTLASGATALGSVTDPLAAFLSLCFLVGYWLGFSAFPQNACAKLFRQQKPLEMFYLHFVMNTEGVTYEP
jgi:hypothetical protein